MKKILFVLLILCLFSNGENLFGQSFGIDINRGIKIKVKDQNGRESEVNLYKGSFALIVGNSNYTNGWRKLPGVSEDLNEVGKTLEEYGFFTEFATDVSRDAFRYRLETFINTHGLNPENQLLIYFAGHGHTEKIGNQDVGYIVMNDAPLPDKNIELFRQRAVEMSEIESLAKRIKAKHALFVFDSCFSGSLTRNSGPKPSPYISSLSIKPVRQFITSGTADQEVPDKSIFRVMFQRGLTGEADFNKDGYVTGSEIGLFLQQKVAEYSENSQTPQFSKIRDVTLDEGDFIFLPEPKKSKNENISELNSECQKVYQFYSLGKKLLEEQKIDEALTQYNKAVNMNVRCAEPYVGRAAVNVLKRNNAQALSDFEKALEIEPQRKEIYSMRAIIYRLIIKDDQKALADFNKAVELCSKAKTCDENDYFYRGNLNQQLGNIDKAIEDFTKVIEIKPLDVKGYQRRGLLYLLEKKELNLAFNDFDKAISIDPNDASTYHNRGAVYLARGTLEKNRDFLIKSVMDFGKAIALNPKSIESYELRIHIFELLGEKEKADADKKRLEELKKQEKP